MRLYTNIDQMTPEERSKAIENVKLSNSLTVEEKMANLELLEAPDRTEENLAMYQASKPEISLGELQ